VAAAGAVAVSLGDVAYADGVFSFRRQPAAAPPPPPKPAAHPAGPADSNEGFLDPDVLERGARALRQINASPYAKMVSKLLAQLP
jgi:ATPase family AAA domain-containing protein 3A/B